MRRPIHLYEQFYLTRTYFLPQIAYHIKRDLWLICDSVNSDYLFLIDLTTLSNCGWRLRRRFSSVKNHLRHVAGAV